MLQQQPDLRQRLGQPGHAHPTRPMPARQVSGELLQDLHILGITARNVRLQHLEDAALAPAAGGIAPGKTDHRADAGFEENPGIDAHGVGFYQIPQLPENHSPHLFYTDI